MRISKRHSRFTSKLMIVLIFIALITVVVAVILANLHEKNYFVNQKFEEIARNYYENTLYPEFIEEHKNEDIDVAFDKHQKYGFTVQLRQILNSELLKNNVNYRPIFEGKDFSCDTNTSSAKFIPQAPFGRTDYVAEFTLNCTND